ncbi:hypothetical protein DFQ01_109171 [Paenibacillus cellulosilyticus]|uniref:DUF2225 domain-containing protein n=1 Tax=Paenibacillus cellulosilyticus TaxID=375489 RepID=A0A2V2YUE8_9BACL|nr:DUF2225 domain-containing protein [Paenibacillus cellulosilyticus]PWW02546.1 hypothetical protein DFQ01_109171 [Paenibacillus cellulosilyticus]QKS47242.1 DUF2225 domain-containing protein [Paenibacillus cellulosilyticus]
MEPLYLTKVSCSCCDTSFMTSRVRPSFKRQYKTDSDFCGYYKEINPEYYVVRICPECGFASTENSTSKLTEKQRSDYWERIGKHWSSRDYSGERTGQQALETYKLALLCAQVINESARVTASVLHHIAWLYRELNNQEQEARFLRFALEAYIQVYETEGSSLNNARLMYLIGELNRRTGNANDAVRWFSRVVNDKRIVDSAMIKASRDQWQLIRSEGLTIADETA